MREIHRLRSEQEAHARSTESAEYNPTLLAELRQLRQRKDELESRMSALQDSRKELMVQLEGLMKLLKVEDEEFENFIAVDNCVFLKMFVWCSFGRYLEVKLERRKNFWRIKVTAWVGIYCVVFMFVCERVNNWRFKFWEKGVRGKGSTAIVCR